MSIWIKSSNNPDL